MKKVTQIIALLSSVLLVSYIADFAYIMGVWPTDDSKAFRMSTLDWAIMAALNVVEFLFLGAIVGTIIYLIIRYSFGREINGGKNPWPFRAAMGTFSIIGTIALIQGIRFFLIKPWF